MEIKVCRKCKKTLKNDTYGELCEDCYAESPYFDKKSIFNEDDSKKVQRKLNDS